MLDRPQLSPLLGLSQLSQLHLDPSVLPLHLLHIHLLLSITHTLLDTLLISSVLLVLDFEFPHLPRLPLLLPHRPHVPNPVASYQDLWSGDANLT